MMPLKMPRPSAAATEGYFNASVSRIQLRHSKIDFEKCRPFKDFGQGFLPHDTCNKLKKWRIKWRCASAGAPIINVLKYRMILNVFPDCS